MVWLVFVLCSCCFAFLVRLLPLLYDLVVYTYCLLSV